MELFKGKCATIGLEFVNSISGSACYRISPNSGDISSFEIWVSTINPDDSRIFKALDETVRNMEENLNNLSEFE